MATKITKRLTRGADQKLAGVCSGLAEYLDLDPTMVRVLWILVTVFSGIIPGIIAYLLAAIVMPAKKQS